MDYKQVYENIKPCLSVPDLFPELCFVACTGGYKSKFHFDLSEHSKGYDTTFKDGIFKDWTRNETFDIVGLFQKMNNCSFAEAVQCLANSVNYQLENEKPIEGKKRANKTTIQPSKQTKKEQKEFSIIADSVVIETLSEKRRKLNVLFNYLQSVLDAEAVRRSFDLYQIGTTKTGGCIYWQIDGKGRTRTGKRVEYKSNGHRNKDIIYNWFIHSELERHGLINGFVLSQCLFGAYLIKPSTKNVLLFEAEKTAVIVSTMLQGVPGAVCVAVGGKQHLSERMLEPLKGCNVSLYADIDGVQEWADKIKPIAEKVGFAYRVVEWWTAAEKVGFEFEYDDKGICKNDYADFVLWYKTKKEFCPTNELKQLDDKTICHINKGTIEQRKRANSGLMWFRLWDSLQIVKADKDGCYLWDDAKSLMEGATGRPIEYSSICSLSAEAIDRYVNGNKLDLLLGPF